jgi:hypothetical protein
MFGLLYGEAAKVRAADEDDGSKDACISDFAFNSTSLLEINSTHFREE